MRMRDTANGDCSAQGKERVRDLKQIPSSRDFVFVWMNESMGAVVGMENIFIKPSLYIYFILTYMCIVACCFCPLICSLASNSSARMMINVSVVLLQHRKILVPLRTHPSLTSRSYLSLIDFSRVGIILMAF